MKCFHLPIWCYQQVDLSQDRKHVSLVVHKYACVEVRYETILGFLVLLVL